MNWVLYSGVLAFPGACVCGDQGMPMVDTGMERPQGLRIYLCPRCVRQAALLHGYIGAEDADHMLGEIERLHATRIELEERLAAAEDPASKIVQVSAGELVEAVHGLLEREKAAAPA
jgi:hypothetical protein